MRWPFFAKYAAVSTATKISANKASTRGLPDSATTASASWSRRDMMQSRRLRSRSQRAPMGKRTQADCAARARATRSGSTAEGVFSKYPRASPVAGFMEGRVSAEMAVAAISGFYMKLRSTSSTGEIPGEPQLGQIHIQCVNFLGAGVSREQRRAIRSEAAPSANGIAEEGVNPRQVDDRA